MIFTDGKNYMQYIIDIVLVAVFVLCIVISAKKGFFVTLFELGSYVISMVAAKFTSSALAPQVYSNIFENSIREQIIKGLGDASKKDYGAQIEKLINSIPSYVDAVMEFIGINKEELLEKVSKADLTGSNAVSSIMKNIVNPVGEAIVQTLMFVVLAIVFTFVLKIVVKLLNSVIKNLPAVKQVNSSLGAAFGALKGIIVVVLLSMFIGVFSGIIGSEEFVDMVNDSLIINAIKGFLASISGYTG